MKIIETNLTFGSMSKRSKTSRIILHHASAKTCSASDIHRWHKARGWSGAGYHYLVRKDGKVYRLRPEKYIGAHASGNNSDSIGICFEGNFQSEKMGDKQKTAGKELVTYLKKKYGLKKVQRHKDVGSTDCPGKNFPFSEIAGASGSVTATATTSKPAQNEDSKKIKADGLWGKETTKLAQKVFKTTVDGIVSNQFSCYKSGNPGLCEGWEWQGKPSGYSPLIKAVQKWCGAKQDGHIGPATIKAMQHKLGCGADGCFNSPSPAIKAFQKWLNKNKQ